MKNSQLDLIMKKQMKNTTSYINIEPEVMNRIKAYEEKKSHRLLHLEYWLSALVLFSGIASIFIIQFILILYSRWFKEYWNFIQITAWSITGIFVLIAFTSFCVIYFSKNFNTEKKLSKSTV